MTRPLVVLGTTGSIGRQAIEVASRLGLEVRALAAGRPSADLVAIARDHPEARLAVAGGSSDERHNLLAELVGHQIDFGTDAIAALAALPGTTVVNGVVGLAGLAPTMAALRVGNRLALANKESLVAAGPLVTGAARTSGAELIPVDSEHSAIFQCLVGELPNTVSRILLTASGGPFRDWSAEAIAKATPQQALKHPNWDMGRRITVDSATLVNKGLEIMEAHQLFGLDYDRIDVLVHPQSVVHSMVEFSDGSVKAQLGPPDMRLPIEYALTYPDRGPRIIEPFSWVGRSLTFEQPDRIRFPALDLAYEAGRQGGSGPCVFNAADEIAVEAFLQGRLGLGGIVRVIAETLASVERVDPSTIDEVVAVDRQARETAAAMIAGVC